MSRRVGKTLLLEKAYRRGDYLYFFVARKNMELSVREHFTLVIDESQEFLRVNPSIYSTMQRDWDLYKGKSRLNLVVCGSINRLMEQIFAADQPLYGRSTGDFGIITKSDIRRVSC